MTGSNNTEKTGDSKTKKKILPASKGRMHEDLPTTGWKGSKIILE